MVGTDTTHSRFGLMSLCGELAAPLAVRKPESALDFTEAGYRLPPSRWVPTPEVHLFHTPARPQSLRGGVLTFERARSQCLQMLRKGLQVVVRFWAQAASDFISPQGTFKDLQSFQLIMGVN
jgi:hypothetical protein